jgi:hypothetical protein
VALKNDGTVVAWGDNVYGQTTVPAGLSGVTAIAAGDGTVALKSDGTVVVWGNNDYGQTTVPAGVSGATAIAAGYYHTVALLGAFESEPAPLAILLDGHYAASGAVTNQGTIQVSFQTTFANGTVHYTLDGSMPSREAVLYTEPFLLTKSATLRAIAYSADSSQSAEAGPIQVVITPPVGLPQLTFTKSNWGRLGFR